jgi:trk system potassium uptake protein TrkH
MRWLAVLRLLGYLVMVMGVAMLVPLALAALVRDGTFIAFTAAIIPAIAGGYVLSRLGKRDEELSFREGFSVVVFGWVACSIIGAMPFWVSGAIPNVIDAYFEAMSGFTTTGSSIISDIEALPPSIILWRSMTQWLGGMGIIVLFIAVLPQLGVGALHLFRAEVPGPVKERFVPRLRDNAKILWYIYVGMTVAAMLTLMLAGMSLFDAVNHGFTTMATGGFSTKNSSIASFDSPIIEYVICFFMMGAGINFTLYWLTITGWWRDVLKDSELRGYMFIIFGATTLITVALVLSGGRYEESFRQALFQVVSIMTTTGFASADYNLWGNHAGMILFFLMFLGGCAGSTAGGIKVGRVVLLYKQGKRELNRFIHPRAILTLRMGSKSIDQGTLINVLQFFFLYIVIFVVGSIMISLTGLDFVTTLSSVATTLGNVGPGFAGVGPMANFAETSSFAKLIFTLLMLLGRLELYTVLVMLMPRFWRE